ncbi:unnamed protein product [Ambrosiozyma monospora]|uniref:Unnamed protein product n=1 Tax=Ambrosiozyma monospora TaxID=43982 RepID=A0ACB5U580_AMBMO|nr:unnamed protein product [Ambrosiozyma monospora]
MEVKPFRREAQTAMMLAPELPPFKECCLKSPSQEFQISFASLPHLKKLQLCGVHNVCLPKGINAPGLSILVIKESDCKFVGKLPSFLRFLEIYKSNVDDILPKLPQLTKLTEFRFACLSSYSIEDLF